MRLNKQAVIYRFESLTPVQRVLIVAILAASIAGGAWNLSLGPNLAGISTLESELESLEMDMLVLSKKASRVPDLEERAGNAARELELARSLLTADEHALERLLASFERLGNEHRVRFLLFQPGPEKVHGYFASRTVQLRLEGSFHELMYFFDALARLDRLVSLKSLSLRPSGQEQAVRDMILTAEARLQVYRALNLMEKNAQEDN